MKNQTSELGELPPFDIQVSLDRSTVWVHYADGSTIGRFSKKWGIDVHRTVTEQIAGASQCLSCTHDAPTAAQWEEFCALMEQHYAIPISRDLISFDSPNP